MKEEQEKAAAEREEAEAATREARDIPIVCGPRGGEPLDSTLM